MGPTRVCIPVLPGCPPCLTDSFFYFSASQPLQSADIKNFPQQSIQTGTDNRRRLEDIVKAFAAGLIAHEVAALGSSSLSVFVRIDMGFMPVDGRWKLFVNEFERLPNACLWAEDDTADNRAGPIAHHLANYLEAERSRRLIDYWVTSEWWKEA